MKRKRMMGMKLTRTFPSKEANYKSQFERDFGQSLILLRKGGCKFRWKYESEKIKYNIEHIYLTDFKLKGNNGKVIFIETKGYFKPRDRTKHLKIREQHPEYDIRFIFMSSRIRQGSDTLISKKSKTTYGSWCEQHNFLYANDKMPKAWLKELQDE